MGRIAQRSFYLTLINYSFRARLLIRCFGSSSAWQPLPVQSLSADLRRGRQPVLPSVRSGSAESFLQRYDGGVLIRSCVLALLSDVFVRMFFGWLPSTLHKVSGAWPERLFVGIPH